MKITFFAIFLLIFACLPLSAEFRTLVSSDGKAIKAELVSHDGKKVTIRREDGKEFELDPGIFCKQDHEAILAWMKANPPKIEYRLRADATRKTTNPTEYTSISHYEISIRNDGQNSVKGVKILYRVLYENWSNQEMQEEEYVLDQNLDFNRTLVLKSEPVSFSRSKSNRNGGMKGCLVRILDAKGEVILDWASNEIGMKDVTWESANPKEPGEVSGPKVEIR